MPTTKKEMGLAVFGHKGSGKSTLTGHLCYRCGDIDVRTRAKLEREAGEVGRLDYALMIERMKSEEGISVEGGTELKLDTGKYRVSVTDAPERNDFVKEMITGL